MDLNEQVARRRAELAESLREDNRAQVVADRRRQDQERVQRNELAAQLAADMNTAGVPARRYGDQLELSVPPPPLPDIEGLKRVKLKAMLNKEARRRWTPSDNWLVISLVAAGVALLHLAGLGVVLIIIGLSRRSTLNDKYRAQVLDDYPALKASLG